MVASAVIIMSYEGSIVKNVPYFPQELQEFCVFSARSREELDISRILFSRCQKHERAVIYLGLKLPSTSSGSRSHSFRESGWTTETGKNPTLVSSDLAPDRGLPSQYLSILLVRSYRTFAPLPEFTGGIFLWHCPHAHAHWVLPSKFGFLGVRTFLRFKLNPQLPRQLFS